MKSFIYFLLGLVLGGLVVLNGASNSKDHYDDAVKSFVSTIDEYYILDVLVETDEWANLNQYVDLSDY